ncbi:MAG: efflux transporter outer membrane subunit, partial [Planctomycetota bacterium]
MSAAMLRNALLSTAALLAACAAVGNDYEAPEVKLPAAWQQALDAGLADGTPIEAEWWRTFEDPVLLELVERALAQNLDLKAAFARLSSVRALRGVAAADQWPSLDARASYEHRQESENTPFGAFIPRTNIHAAGVDAAWELDLWGRVRRAIEAAERDLEASEAELQGAALSVAAEVVSTYVDLRAAQRRLQIAQSNLELQERTLGLVEARSAAGLVVERDVAQAATNVESTRSRMPMLEAEAIAAQNRLAVLLGRAPGDLPMSLSEPGKLPVVPTRIAVGVPADLLRRRPDVRRAERRFAAEVARVGQAEADRYPRFSLVGTLGLASNSA